MILRNYLEKKRELLYDEIHGKSCCGRDRCGWSGSELMRSIFLQATYEAMRHGNRGSCLGKLGKKPDLLLNDAVTIPEVDDSTGADHQGRCEKCFHCGGKCRCESHKGPSDGSSTTRFLPGYGFADNKGYGSAAHIAALRRTWSDADSPAYLYYTFCLGQMMSVFRAQCE